MGGIDRLKSDLRYLATDEGKTQDARLKIFCYENGLSHRITQKDTGKKILATD